MSTYLISDIHGYNQTFRKALKKIGLKKHDRLIILGDLIDRGPDSKGVLDTIFLLKEHNFNVQCIKGNHEQLFLDAFTDITAKVNWFKNGGKRTLQSFLTSEIESIPEKYISFIKSLDTHLVIDNYILVHAGINMTADKPFEDEHSLLWLRDWKSFYNKDWLGERVVIHGHTPIDKHKLKKQFDSDNSIPVRCIDNGIYFKEEDGFGEICVLKLDDLNIYFQENEDY